MGSKHVALHSFFWIKVLLAIALSGVGLSFMGKKVVDMHNEAAKTFKFKNDLKTKPTAIDPTKCQTNQNLGRLEPPDGSVFVGFHLNWAEQVPTNVSQLLKFYPAI